MSVKDAIIIGDTETDISTGKAAGCFTCFVSYGYGTKERLRDLSPDSAAKFSGGGTLNKTLMNRIRELLPEIKFDIFDEEYANTKEAMAFAILANETFSGLPCNLSGATGAGKAVVLGEIAL